MTNASALRLPRDLEARFFWWETLGPEPRSDIRILAQAMALASFDDVRRLETALGAKTLADAMRQVEPGWIDARSWEFWRGRLSCQTEEALPNRPPTRNFDA